MNERNDERLISVSGVRRTSCAAANNYKEEEVAIQFATVISGYSTHLLADPDAGETAGRRRWP